MGDETTIWVERGFGVTVGRSWRVGNGVIVGVAVDSLCTCEAARAECCERYSTRIASSVSTASALRAQSRMISRGGFLRDARIL